MTAAPARSRPEAYKKGPVSAPINPARLPWVPPIGVPLLRCCRTRHADRIHLDSRPCLTRNDVPEGDTEGSLKLEFLVAESFNIDRRFPRECPSICGLQLHDRYNLHHHRYGGLPTAYWGRASLLLQERSNPYRLPGKVIPYRCLQQTFARQKLSQGRSDKARDRSLVVGQGGTKGGRSGTTLARVFTLGPWKRRVTGLRVGYFGRSWGTRDKTVSPVCPCMGYPS
jgi:hypothetical protein